MATPNLDRRNSMALDEAYQYCRLLENGDETPVLHKIVSAIHTIDLATDPERKMSPAISAEAWSRVRDSLFGLLVSSFAGYFVVYSDEDLNSPIEQGSAWPKRGRLEFYPEAARRRTDYCESRLERLDPEVSTSLRWLFARGQQTTNPEHFAKLRESEGSEEERGAVSALLEKFYEICEREALAGKKRAHHKWWQLYWDENSCQDKQKKRELRKELLELQSVWGQPAAQQ